MTPATNLSGLLRSLEAASGTREKGGLLLGFVCQHSSVESANPPAQASQAQLAWSIRLLSGVGLGRRMAASKIREALAEVSGLPLWLVEESHESVGDLAETCALLLQDLPVAGGESAQPWGLLQAIEAAQQQALKDLWHHSAPADRFAHTKLITGGLRVGVSRGLVARVLSQWLGAAPADMALRLSVFLSATPTTTAVQAAWSQLLEHSRASVGQGGVDPPGPRPFFLAQSLEASTTAEDLQGRLGDVQDWQVEWKWDGIRAQAWISEREPGAAQRHVQLWSRGEEDISQSFPDLCQALAVLPAGLLIDGEILAMVSGSAPGAEASVAPFSALQLRLGRKSPSANFCKEHPVGLRAYDLLRDATGDLRSLPLAERRARLEATLKPSVASPSPLSISPILACSSWQDAAQWRSQARAMGVEGLMIKRRDATYGVGRSKSSARGEVWKWKLQPLAIDAVLVYAQRGHGRRAGLYTDYGFALWDTNTTPPQLVPFAKAYSGLSDEEIRQVDATIRSTILEKFGPVRSVAPTLVMELGFEGVMESKRHKSGVAVRFPRILRLRPDKRVQDANSLADLRALVHSLRPSEQGSDGANV